MAFKLRVSNKEQTKTRTYQGIKLSEKNHAALLQHVKDRLDFGREMRDTQIDRFKEIDRELAGFLRLDDDDKKRREDNKRGKGPKPTDLILPLTHTQIREATTYMLSVLAPDGGMYSAIAPKEKQDEAQAFSKLMNRHGAQFGHYRQYARGFRDMFAYNFGGFLIEWRKIFGNKIDTDNAQNITVARNVVTIEGNYIEAIDPYNFIYDISVPLPQLNIQGEFFAMISLVTPYRIKRMIANQEIFYNGDIDSIPSTTECTYYKARPEVRGTDSDAGSVSDWTQILTAGTKAEIGRGIELVTYYGWIIPADFGISNSRNYEIWRIVLIGDQQIVALTEMTNAHGLLPCAMGSPLEDGFGNQTKSFAEFLNPLQRFASFQMNVHQRAARKALYGLVIYDQDVIPMMEEADLLGGKVPAKFSRQERDLRKSFAVINDAPDTRNTMQDIGATNDLMQKVLPTDIVKQVANLERATTYQAAAVVQGGNRSNHTLAKIINDQAMIPGRFMQMYNLFQYQDSIEFIDPNSGQLIQVNPKQLNGEKIEFAISDGLKGIDKLIVVEAIKDTINFILQSQIAQQQIDIVSMIDYWTSLMGDNTDFNQFKFRSPLDALSPELKQQAFQLLQAAMQQQGAGGQAKPNGSGAVFPNGTPGIMTPRV